MAPHSGFGGATPTPMKERPAAESIMLEMVIVASTMMGSRALGRMCLTTSLMDLVPLTRAALT